LTQISRYLKLSPNVAGVTFLALGNGAPDIASIIAGVFTGSAGFGIGEPIGAGLFVTTGVMAAVCIFSKVKVDGAPFLRDTGIYLLSVTFVFLVCIIQGKIYLWHAITCLLIYFIYVTVVIVGRLIHVYRKSRQLNEERKQLQEQKRILTSGTSVNEGSSESENSGLLTSSSSLTRKMGKNSARYYQSVEDDDEIELGGKWHKKPMLLHFVTEKKIRKKRVPRRKKNQQPTDEESPIQIDVDEEEVDTPVDLPVRKEWGNLQILPIDDKERFATQLKRSGSNAFFVPKIGIIYENSPVDDSDNYGELRKTSSFIIEDHFTVDPLSITEEDNVEVEDSYYEQFIHWIEWDEKSWFDRLFYILVSPAVLARNLTIPQADPESWSKFFAVLSPMFIGPFALFATGYLTTTLGKHFPLWVLVLMISIIISGIIFVTSSRSRPPSRYHFIFVFAAFFCSVLWIYLVANELVSILQSCGVMWQISDGILALTVLAWGNSLGDMVSNVVVARQGFPEMALAACYGGPCMNLLIGLGVSMTAHCLKYNSFDVNLESNVFMSFIFLLGSIISALLVLSLNKFQAPKIYGAFLLSLYGVFMVLSLLVESGLLFKHV
jgi:sodium/potassium/calcium exchanger 6